MSETPHNDREHDAQLTAMYRAAGQDAPPAALDAAILAAARREVAARPRPADYSFGRAWRAPLSIAAVIVLSVSLVTLMREEAPELAAPPRADAPPPDATPKSAYELTERKSQSFGLQPSQPGPAVGLGIRAPAPVGSRQQADEAAHRADVDSASAALAKRRQRVADAADSRGSKAVVSGEMRRESGPTAAQEVVQVPPAAASRDAAAKPPAALAPRPVTPPAPGLFAGEPAENKAQAPAPTASADRAESESQGRRAAAPARNAMPESPVPATAPMPAAKGEMQPPAKPPAAAVALSKLESDADLPPEKWLQRIEELRKQGRFDEAKASLANFRKRYPDYRLPESLRGWAQP
jgi:hypothetical protein